MVKTNPNFPAPPNPWRIAENKPIAHHEEGKTMPQQAQNIDQEMRIVRLRKSLRALSALAWSEYSPDDALIGRRGDLSDLLEILGDELEAATAHLTT